MDIINWHRSPGHRDGEVLAAYEGSSPNTLYLVESRADEMGRRVYRAFVRAGYHFDQLGDVVGTRKAAYDQAEKHHRNSFAR